MKFTLLKKDALSKARLGLIETSHGTIETPVFMPVGTRAAIKAMTHQALLEMGAQIMVGNTYHLILRPGVKIISEAGGLHQFMNWPKPILSDSGGYQAFSLAAFSKVQEEGIYFKSHVDGSKHFLGPQQSLNAQKILGSDIALPLDQCSPYPCDKPIAENALQRTQFWAEQSRDYPLLSHQSLFGIIQGGLYTDLRKQATTALVKLNFDGYALGGLSVGMPQHLVYELIEAIEPLLPMEKPRYLMGMGTPRNIVEAVMRGIDMFDCSMPTRNARHGTAFTWSGKMIIKAGRFAKDFSRLDPELNAYPSYFLKAYVHHLLNVGEITGLILMTWQNLAFYFDFMQKLRQAIASDTLMPFYQRLCKIYPERM